MNPNIISLEEIQIAKPCRADWNRMTGDEQTRFCGSCHKNVYDISQMTRADAQKLIAEKEGNLCLRLYHRPDGTVITSDCPVGIAAPSRPLWWGVAALVALIGSGLAGCAAPGETMGDVAPVSSLADGKVQTQPLAPIQVETPPMDFGNVESVPITNGSVPDGQHLGVTLGVPMMPTPTPKSPPKPKPTPTDEPLMGKPTMGKPTMGRIVAPPVAAETTMGEIGPICEQTR